MMGLQAGEDQIKLFSFRGRGERALGVELLDLLFKVLAGVIDA
jgi:hypothetical protein